MRHEHAKPMEQCDVVGDGRRAGRRDPLDAAAQGTENGEWRSYGGDIANTRYAPLDQITADNFEDLEVAWRVKTENFGPNPEFNLESTPLMIGGVVYSTAGSRRAVIAVDAGTGELLWMHRLDEGERGAAAPRRLSGRGLAYRDDGGDGQIFYVTPGYQLIGLDAANGRRIAGFGTDGIVDLKQNFDQEIDLVTGEAGLHAAPIVVGDMIVVGAAHLPGGSAKSMRNVKGYVRGFDARTGDRRWIFHTIPGADEFGNDSWLNDSWRYTGNTGVWGQISVDPELGIAYLPTEMPTNDYYGGHRHGDNLFSDSLVAVDLETGERLWHYQFIHHDVWDWDIPCAPISQTSSLTAWNARSLRSRRSRRGCTSSIVRPESRSGRLKSVRSKPRTSQESCCHGPSRFRRSHPPTIDRALTSTISLTSHRRSAGGRKRSRLVIGSARSSRRRSSPIRTVLTAR